MSSVVKQTYKLYELYIIRDLIAGNESFFYFRRKYLKYVNLDFEVLVSFIESAFKIATFVPISSLLFFYHRLRAFPRMTVI